jgi:ribosomal RNA-processing protein 12
LLTLSQKPKTTSGNAFDDILYNSDSDLESDEGEDEGSKGGRQIKPLGGNKKGKKAQQSGAYIRNEGDQPMDLLSRSIAGGVSSESQSASSGELDSG